MSAKNGQTCNSGLRGVHDKAVKQRIGRLKHRGRIELAIALLVQSTVFCRLESYNLLKPTPDGFMALFWVWSRVENARDRVPTVASLIDIVNLNETPLFRVTSGSAFKCALALASAPHANGPPSRANPPQILVMEPVRKRAAPLPLFADVAVAGVQ